MTCKDHYVKLKLATCNLQSIVLAGENLDPRLVHTILQSASIKLPAYQSTDFQSEPLDNSPTLTAPHNWRICYLNSNYEQCPSYGSTFVVPESVSDSVIRHACKYRSRNRLPILSYIHTDNHAPLTRAAQPLMGLSQQRCIQDEHLIDAIRISSPNQKLIVVDARPELNAVVNTIQGAGAMNMANYKNCERIYADIPNIHKVRQVYCQKILSDISASSTQSTSQWQEYANQILQGGVSPIVDAILKGNAVLVHCSCGWDRTSQLTSLARVILDPKSRTIQGLMKIYWDEWLMAGHQLELRSGRWLTINQLLKLQGSALTSIFSVAEDSQGIRQVSPVFGQFLYILLLLMDRNPTAFEYSEEFIRQLWIDSCINPTANPLFNGNCMKDRPNLQWSHCIEYLELHSNTMRNTNYDQSVLEISYQ